VIDLGLAGKVALVTGAGGGIGRSVADWFGRAGAAVAVNDIDASLADVAVTELRAAGVDAVAVPADVRNADAVDAMVAAVVDRLGSLDVAVNNVGSLGGEATRPFVEVDAAYARTIVDQNLLATTLCCVAEARAMVAGGRGGVILNVTSGETTRPALGLAVYGASKAAINHLTTTMAAELGPHGIRVNAVAPGTTLTPAVRAAFDDDHVAALVRSIPLGRMCEPDDLARLAVLLASDLAAMVTGQVILADGGAHLSRSRPAAI